MLFLINGADGCAWARDHGAVAIVVDTLRASTTVAILLERAKEVLVVRTVEDARMLAAERPGALLAGERQGLRPEGFDLGNSPIAARSFDCTGRTVIFTSTTGAARAVATNPRADGPKARNRPSEIVPVKSPYTRGVPALFMGAPVNAQAIALAAKQAAEALARDIVLIPAGHVNDDPGAGREDAAGATVIGLTLQALGVPLAPGTVWAFAPSPPDQIPVRAAEAIRSSLHAHLLYALGPEFVADVEFCCRLDETNTVPRCRGTIPLPGGEVGVVFVSER